MTSSLPPDPRLLPMPSPESDRASAVNFPPAFISNEAHDIKAFAALTLIVPYTVTAKSALSIFSDNVHVVPDGTSKTLFATSVSHSAALEPPTTKIATIKAATQTPAGVGNILEINAVAEMFF
ncbi:hypothetical protein DPMN_117898 [Dreissena polymorpha]|uniref:Uncharacterized protein n=1 Tax=Dreissena polymorpha TaxID=45954 RepID=A0A9D4JQM2_DREPO|nr:hypothetical protein DPMN_117898 [Dreissena polymorpha]